MGDQLGRRQLDSVFAGEPVRDAGVDEPEADDEAENIGGKPGQV